MGNRSIPAETKQAILEDAKGRILEGHTLTEIAEGHGISKRTLNTWLMALGDEYQELRQVWIDNMLAEAKEAIDKNPIRKVWIEQIKREIGAELQCDWANGNLSDDDLLAALSD